VNGSYWPKHVAIIKLVIRMTRHALFNSVSVELHQQTQQYTVYEYQNFSVLTVILQKVLLRVQLHKALHNRKGRFSLMSAEVERSQFEIVCKHVCTCTHLCYTHQEIRSFIISLLAARVTSDFDIDTTHLYVRKIIDTLCKVKTNPSIFSLKCIFA